MADESATSSAATSGGCGFRSNNVKRAAVDSISCLHDVILQLRFLDLSKSLRLRTLVVDHNSWVATKIEAPHIHRLHLRNSQSPCALVDVSSITEANLNIFFQSVEATFNADFLQDMLLKSLNKLQHVEKLTLGGKFLQILSLAELCDVPFPMLKVKALTLETTKIFQYVIPGIERVLQNSHDLKKLTIHTRHCNTTPGEHLDKYLALEGLDPAQCWRSKDGVRWNKSRLGNTWFHSWNLCLKTQRH